MKKIPLQNESLKTRKSYKKLGIAPAPPLTYQMAFRQPDSESLGRDDCTTVDQQF